MEAARVVEELDAEGPKVDPQMDLARLSGVGDGDDDRNVPGQHGNGMLCSEHPGTFRSQHEVVLDHGDGLCRYPKELLPSHLHESQ